MEKNKSNSVKNNNDEKDIVIKIKNLKKSFDSQEVLCGVTLDVKKNENVVVLGKSGSGKSVLIKCLVRLMEPDLGEMNVLGMDVTELNNKQLNGLRKKIGFLFQGAALYDSMTVEENLLFPLKRHFKKKSSEELDEMVREALEHVGLADAIDKMPSELSGGMRKRVGVARTIIMQPEIMLYDEPTTGLDPVTGAEISELILKMQEKLSTTSIIITHDMSCAKTTANRLMVLKDGVIAAEGTYREIQNSEDEMIQSFFK